MAELLRTLRRLLGGRHPSAPPPSQELDRERAASMADEGGAAAARVEAQPRLARPVAEQEPEGTREP